ncbi:MAG: glycerophosphodiester phosphodiesterase [Anaerolineae bacterium]|nr:glycerophosphodiester phosphodiesterase [Anaerolineae bacterium]
MSSQGCTPDHLKGTMGFDLRRHVSESPRIVAHRGASALAPENTMAAFERAWRDGADIIELDVRLSADRHVVVIHDAGLERTTNGVGLVSDWAASELRRLDAGSWFGAQYAGEHIPTLREVLDWARGKLAVMLELKFAPWGSFDPLLVPEVVTAIDETEMVEQVVVISFQPRALVQLKVLAPAVPAGPIPPRDGLLILAVGLVRRFTSLGKTRGFRQLLTRPLRYTHGWGCDIVSPNIDVATTRLVETAHAAGYPVSCGGLRWDYPHAIQLGVDTISANDPARIRELYL